VRGSGDSAAAQQNEGDAMQNTADITARLHARGTNGSRLAPASERPLDTDTLAKRYEALSGLSRSLAFHTPEELVRNLAGELSRLLDFDLLDIVVYKEGSTEVDWHAVEAGPLASSTPPTDWTSSRRVYQEQQPLWVADSMHDDRSAVRKEMLETLGFRYRSVCRVPLTTPHRRLGVLGVASRQPYRYSDEDVQFVSAVANYVALAIAEVQNLETSRRSQSELDLRNSRLKLLLELTNSVVSNRDLRDVLKAALTSTRQFTRSDWVGVNLPDADSGQLRVFALDFPGGEGILDQEAQIPLEGTLPGRVFRSGKLWAGRIGDLNPGERESYPTRAAAFKTACHLPLVSRDRILGTLGFARRDDSAYTQDEIQFLTQVSNQIAIAVEHALVFREIAQLKDKLAVERLYLESEIRTEHNFEAIVGESPALRNVLQRAEVVAPTDSTVLILGETGTGKELIARAIHDRSDRHDRTFVKINCAAIPTGLLESELFGHERGAFTGAIAQKIGRFEVANGGTLFLDEVGEIPLELQPKLLRVLQEQEFERIGGTKTIKVDVRLVAATNRNLAEMVEQQRFRDDLYYRLNVFPLEVPPLRQRLEDIPALVRYFVQLFARRMDRRIEVIPRDALEAMRQYPWPGNIRELANLIERATILSPGPTLNIPLTELKPVREVAKEPAPHGNGATTLEGLERAHIVAVLEEANWLVGSPRGAAARLGMKRTTLLSLMKRLGVTRPATA
jgi:formate hydrogenlyase transcriptional activator